MADLETAARALAEALDSLEARLDQRLHDLADAEDVTAAVRRQSSVAHRFAAVAAGDLAAAVDDLRALLDGAARRDG